jgi:hypothetical protein
MLLSFLIELTAMHPEERTKIFKTELSKVFMTTIVFNFFVLCLTAWLQSLGNHITVQTNRAKEYLANQRRIYEEKLINFKKNMKINPGYYKHKDEPTFKPKPIIDENRDFVIAFEEKGIGQ